MFLKIYYTPLKALTQQYYKAHFLKIVSFVKSHVLNFENSQKKSNLHPKYTKLVNNNSSTYRAWENVSNSKIQKSKIMYFWSWSVTFYGCFTYSLFKCDYGLLCNSSVIFPRAWHLCVSFFLCLFLTPSLHPYCDWRMHAFKNVRSNVI